MPKTRHGDALAGKLLRAFRMVKGPVCAVLPKAAQLTAHHRARDILRDLFILTILSVHSAGTFFHGLTGCSFTITITFSQCR